LAVKPPLTGIFVVSQTELLLQILVGALNAPAHVEASPLALERESP
jgi:hypothetical protein